MRSRFIHMNTRADDIACSGNTQVLLFPGNSDCGLQLESSCYRSFGCSRPYVNIIWVQRRITVRSAQYFNVMRNELQPAFCTKQKGRHTHFFCTWPCCLTHTMTTLETLNWKFLVTWPMWILACPDFYVLGPLKETLWGWQFAVDDVKEAVHDWFFAHPKNKYSSDCKKLVDQ